MVSKFNLDSNFEGKHVSFKRLLVSKPNYITESLKILSWINLNSVFRTKKWKTLPEQNVTKTSESPKKIRQTRRTCLKIIYFISHQNLRRFKFSKDLTFWLENNFRQMCGAGNVNACGLRQNSPKSAPRVSTSSFISSSIIISVCQFWKPLKALNNGY